MAQSWWQWLRGWWNIGTLGGFSRLYDTISKIRARHGTRLRAAQTAGAADSHESQRRGREVFRRKVGHTPRHYPVRRSALYPTLVCAVLSCLPSELCACPAQGAHLLCTTEFTGAHILMIVTVLKFDMFLL